MDKNTHFPQFRKLSNGKAFYRITSERAFEEIQIAGSKRILHTITANQYPEMIRIKDMLECGFAYEMSDEKEFNSHFIQL